MLKEEVWLHQAKPALMFTWAPIAARGREKGEAIFYQQIYEGLDKGHAEQSNKSVPDFRIGLRIIMFI